MLTRTAVELLYSERRKVDAFKAANIDCGSAVAGWVGSLAKRMDAALGAEVMLDGLCAECVGGQVFFGRKQAKIFSRNKPV